MKFGEGCCGGAFGPVETSTRTSWRLGEEWWVKRWRLERRESERKRSSSSLVSRVPMQRTRRVEVWFS